MKKIIAILILCLFIICKEKIVVNALLALEFWSKQLFPLLFPTFILTDFLLSTSIINLITKKFGYLYEKIFKTNKYGLFIFLISMLVGSPTNAKILKHLKDEGLIDDKDINKILAHSIMFNPFLIINFGGFRLLLVLWFANLFVGLLFRNVYPHKNKIYKDYVFNFDINSSINKNLDIMINILGVVVLFSSIIAFIPSGNNLIRFFLISCLELTSAISFTSSIMNSNIFAYALCFSLGGFSIIMQIKSILKDTSLNYNLLILSRLVVALIAECFLKCIFT